MPLLGLARRCPPLEMGIEELADPAAGLGTAALQGEDGEGQPEGFGLADEAPYRDVVGGEQPVPRLTGR